MKRWNQVLEADEARREEREIRKLERKVEKAERDYKKAINNLTTIRKNNLHGRA